MRSVDGLFADYADHHRTGMNKATHSLGIPMIGLALLGLGSRITLYSIENGPSLDLGVAFAAALVATYLTWHVGLALGAAVLAVPLYLLGALLTLPWLVVVLVVGVGLQYLGHYAFEGHGPAFHKNMIHALVGPLWMVALLFRTLGLFAFREDAL